MNCAPVVYEHAASFTGKSPHEVSVDPVLLAEAHIAAWKYYRHTPVTVGIDIYNLEAEAWGSVVDIPEGNEVPGISGAIFDSPERLLELEPLNIDRSGRYPLHMKAAALIREALPDADVRLPLSGPFSIASNLVGFEKLLMASVMEQAPTAAALMHIAGLQVDLARQIYNAGFDVSFFESAAAPPLLSPELIRAVELPALRFIMESLADLNGNKNALIMGGDNAAIAEDLATTGAGFLIAPAETDQEAFLNELEGSGVTVRINMSAEIISAADREAIASEIERVKRLIKRYPSALAGTGVLPYNADPELVSWIIDKFR